MTVPRTRCRAWHFTWRAVERAASSGGWHIFGAPVPRPGSHPIAPLDQLYSQPVPSRAWHALRRVVEDVALAEVIENRVEGGRQGSYIRIFIDHQKGVNTPSSQPRGVGEDVPKRGWIHPVLARRLNAMDFCGIRFHVSSAKHMSLCC